MTEPNRRQKAIAWQEKRVTPVILVIALVLVLGVWWASGWSGWIYPLIALLVAFAIFKYFTVSKE